MLSNAGTTVGNIVLTSTGRLRLRDATLTIAESAPLVVGTTYQVTIHQRAGTGANAIVEAFVAPVGTPATTPFARRAVGTWTSSADRLRVGATNSNAVDLTVDDVQLAAGGLPADLTATGVAGGGALMVAAAGLAIIAGGRGRWWRSLAVRRTEATDT